MTTFRFSNAVCKCRPNYTGDPYTNCNCDPCSSNPCGQGAFSENNVYPGHGCLYIRRDGQPVQLGSTKAKSMYLQRMKPSKLQWTQAWRRLNKKMVVDTMTKKRTRKTTKFTRAIVGMAVEEVGWDGGGTGGGRGGGGGGRGGELLAASRSGPPAHADGITRRLGLVGGSSRHEKKR